MFLYEMLRQSAAAYPDKTALIYQNTSLSYLKLINIVDSLQGGFEKMGINPNDRVGLILHNSIDFVICLYALSKNKNIICLLNPQYCVGEIEQKISEAMLDKIIVESYINERISQENKLLFNLFQIILKEDCTRLYSLELVSDHNICESVANENIEALIQSTSGSTGNSKMAYRSHKNLDLDSISIIQTMNYTKDDVIVTPVPLYHGYGLTMGLIAPIRIGATIYIQRWFECNQFLKRYEELKPTIFLGVPEIYDCICAELKKIPYNFTYNKWFLCSGSPLSIMTGEKFYEISGVWLSQIYGMMEVSTICANLHPNKDNFVSVGQPVKDIQIKYKTTGQDKHCEIFVLGETVSKRYVTINGNCMIANGDGWFDTKDIGYVENNDLYLIGRKGSEEKWT